MGQRRLSTSDLVVQDRLDADRDGHCSALAHKLAEVGFWSGLPPAQAQRQQCEVAAGGYPFTCAVLDDVTFFADGEDLAEGDVENLLREMAPALRRFGLELRVHTVSGNDSGEYVVDINGRRRRVLDAGDWRDNSSWLLATVRPSGHDQRSTRPSGNTGPGPYVVRGWKRGPDVAARPGDSGHRAQQWSDPRSRPA
jgi:hypothetical protein